MLEEAAGNILMETCEMTEILGKLRVNHRREEGDETNNDTQQIVQW